MSSIRGTAPSLVNECIAKGTRSQSLARYQFGVMWFVDVVYLRPAPTSKVKVEIVFSWWQIRCQMKSNMLWVAEIQSFYHLRQTVQS